EVVPTASLLLSHNQPPSCFVSVSASAFSLTSRRCPLSFSLSSSWSPSFRRPAASYPGERSWARLSYLATSAGRLSCTSLSFGSRSPQHPSFASISSQSCYHLTIPPYPTSLTAYEPSAESRGEQPSTC
ncbi:hypothetical protein CVT26_015399, partial [Gymnopilus dilepis]